MKQTVDKNRKELEAKLADVFDEEISKLPDELRCILLDDMVTAFENRLTIFNSVVAKTDN
ncbi:MAG: hypothetical protein WC203_05845 [Candidatus Bathyarchaeia archaeon]|jgi:uncharacterized protein YbcI|nr:hypothetical protein [Thermoproteota archaeon]MDT8781611.1 hypothetical protein [Candidatus Bathyarchaeota archaeon]NLD66906.1 hypothetical protein [Thermoproteota archaeon]